MLEYDPNQAIYKPDCSQQLRVAQILLLEAAPSERQVRSINELLNSTSGQQSLTALTGSGTREENVLILHSPSLAFSSEILSLEKANFL